MRNLTIKSTLASLLYILSSTAWAGSGSLVYGPVPPIPTLSGTMLILLSLLLATIGYRVLQQKGNDASRMMVLSLIVVGALASGIGGVKLINNAYANGFPTISLNQPGGGTATVCIDCGPYHYQNDTGAPLEIKSRIHPEPCGWGTVTAPECTAGLLLGDGDACQLDLFCVP